MITIKQYENIFFLFIINNKYINGLKKKYNFIICQYPFLIKKNKERQVNIIITDLNNSLNLCLASFK